MTQNIQAGFFGFVKENPLENPIWASRGSLGAIVCLVGIFSHLASSEYEAGRPRKLRIASLGKFKKKNDASAYFGPGGGSQFEGYPLPSSRLGSSFSRCAPATTSPKVYAEHYAARADACRGYHIGSLQELPHTMCAPLVPLLVAFYDPW